MEASTAKEGGRAFQGGGIKQAAPAATGWRSWKIESRDSPNLISEPRKNISISRKYSFFRQNAAIHAAGSLQPTMNAMHERAL